MRFNLIKNILGLVSVSSLAFAQTAQTAQTVDNCSTITSLIGTPSVKDCKENVYGQITGLDVELINGSSANLINKIFSIDTLESLKFSTHNLLNNVLPLQGLTNLVDLDLSIYNDDGESFSVERGNISNLSLPMNLKKLKLEGIEFTQNVINEILKVTGLEELVFQFCDYNNVNLKGFNYAKNLYSLTISEKENDGFLGSNVISNFPNIRMLNLNSVELGLENLKEISSLKFLEKLGLDATSQKNLMNIGDLFSKENPIKILNEIKELAGSANFISKEDHINRNIHQSHMAPVNAAQMDVYCELGLFTKWNNTGTHNLKDKDNFFTRLESFVGGKRGTNCDYRGVIGTVFEGCQFVYDVNGEIVVNSLNKGTWDTSSPQNLQGQIVHVFNDVLPWLLWGNGEADEPEFQIMTVENQQKVAAIISQYKNGQIDKETAKTSIEQLFTRH